MQRMSVPTLWRPVLLLAGACFLGVAGGCKGPKTEVSGTIKLNGQPPRLKGMEITFLAKDGRMASAPVNEDGSFTCSGVPLGEVRVGFPYFPAEAAKARGKGAGPPKPGVEPKPGHPLPNPIPEKLRESSTSPVVFQVEPGKPFDYDIKP
jgi:hypothetical protein